MAGVFHGEVKPIYGRWHWPLRVMQPGDWFIVDQALRNSEELRHVMGVRAAQLGIPLSITKEDPDYPGFTKVTRPEISESKRDGLVMQYGDAGAKLQAWYGFNIDALPFGELYHRQKARVNAVQVKEPSVSRMIVETWDSRLGLTFDERGFDVVQLAKHATLESWKRGASLDEVMS